MKHLLFSLLGMALLLGGCAQTRGTQKPPAAITVTEAPAPPKKKKRRGPITVSYTPPPAHHRPVATLRLRTTAYTGKKNAISGKLSHGPVTSAAADWSKFPLGTRFRVKQTGKIYVIDDYGSALTGTKTLDLAKRHKGEVRKWGARWVDIEILEWGSPRKSLEVLTPRRKVSYITPMVHRLRTQSEGWPAEFHRVEPPDDLKVEVRQVPAQPRRQR